MGADAEIRRTLHTYCRMLDERDLGRLEQVYLPTATDDRKRGTPLAGIGELRAYFQRSFEHVEYTAHMLSNVDIDLHADGERATVYSRVSAYHWLSGGDPVRPADFLLLGSYDDELVRTDDGWRISSRVVGALGQAGLAAGSLPAVFSGFGGNRP